MCALIPIGLAGDGRNKLFSVGFLSQRRGFMTEAMQRNPERKERMMAADELAEKFEPELYAVASVCE